MINEFILGYFLELFMTMYNTKGSEQDQDQRKTERDSRETQERLDKSRTELYKSSNYFSSLCNKAFLFIISGNSHKTKWSITKWKQYLF